MSAVGSETASAKRVSARDSECRKFPVMAEDKICDTLDFDPAEKAHLHALVALILPHVSLSQEACSFDM